MLPFLRLGRWALVIDSWHPFGVIGCLGHAMKKGASKQVQQVMSELASGLNLYFYNLLQHDREVSKARAANFCQKL